LRHAIGVAFTVCEAVMEDKVAAWVVIVAFVTFVVCASLAAKDKVVPVFPVPLPSQSVGR